MLSVVDQLSQSTQSINSVTLPAPLPGAQAHSVDFHALVAVKRHVCWWRVLHRSCGQRALGQRFALASKINLIETAGCAGEDALLGALASRLVEVRLRKDVVSGGLFTRRTEEAAVQSVARSDDAARRRAVQHAAGNRSVGW